MEVLRIFTWDVKEHMRNEALIHQRRDGINYITTFFMVVFHIGAIAALFMFTWPALLVSLVLAWVAGGAGIGMGFHRLLTHRGYKTPKAIEYILTIFGTLSLEGGPINWVATHRIHHAHTDVEGDPHTPRDGAWWAHMGWILVGTGQQYPQSVLERYAPDLCKDRVHMLINKYYYVPIILLGAALFALGGWPMLMWGMFLRTTLGLHGTWLVNSATHMWGSRRFETRDDSRNNWWVALLSFGEGWHNNHHAHPAAARHGLRWYEIDFNWYGIRTLEIFGLAKDIKLIKADGKAVRRSGDNADQELRAA
ncbi:MAG: fatty acid desaturase [Pyrinomonadaceae bacterium]